MMLVLPAFFLNEAMTTLFMSVTPLDTIVPKSTV